MEESQLSFAEYVVEVTAHLRMFQEWRMGQAAYNVLYKVRPDLVEDLSDHFDPFYDDEVLPEFLAFVVEKW